MAKHTNPTCTHQTNLGVPMEDKMVEMPSAQSQFTNKTRTISTPTKAWLPTRPRTGSTSRIRCNKCLIKMFKMQRKINTDIQIKTQIMPRDHRQPTRLKGRSNREACPITSQIENSSRWIKKLLSRMHLMQAKLTQARHPSTRRWLLLATSLQVFTQVTAMGWTLKASRINLQARHKVNTLPHPR